MTYVTLVLLIYWSTLSEGALSNGQPSNKNENDVKTCTLDCKHGGTCQYLNLADRTQQHCKCKRGWTGETCGTCLGRLEREATFDPQTIHDGYGNYSSSYTAKCSWLIKAPPAGRDGKPPPLIQLNVTSFETECGWDHLYVFDGTSAHNSSLVAALCGIMRSPPTLYASSGFAFLHFYSDMAYNMSGFNIQYKLVEAKSTDQSQSIRMDELDQGIGQWVHRTKFDPKMAPRSTPAVFALNNTVYIWGGYQFNENDDKMWKFNTATSTFASVDREQKPSIRYAAPTSRVGENSFLMYGGVTFPNYTMLGDVWIYRTLSDTWQALSPSTSAPLAMSGHSLVTVTFENGTEVVLSFGGYVSKFGYTSLVQEFDFSDVASSTFSVRIPFTFGRRIPGSFGHVALVDQASNSWIVYVYAGYQNNVVSDTLVVYDALKRTFDELPPSSKFGGSNRWFHSGALVGEHLYFFSGNSHNDTTQSAGSLCYSDEVLQYSIKCRSWSKVVNAAAWYPRYGAVSLTVNDRIYTVGGFNGQLLSDILVFSPQVSSSASDCPISREEASCAPPSISKETDELLLTKAACSYCTYGQECRYCPEEQGQDVCSATGLSLSQKFPDDQCKSSRTDCADFASYSCLRSHKKCSSCVLSGCVFSVRQDTTKKTDKTELMACIAPENVESEMSQMTVVSQWRIFNQTDACSSSKNADLFECGTFSNCTECTKHHNCMWCGSLSVCVSNEAYVTSFPFGQCLEWFQKQNCQRTRCEGHLTCKSCQSDPRCGWCDDGTMTGSGVCKDGTLTGDNDGRCNAINNVNRWFWLKCPACNCSGHSKCDLVTHECKNCGAHTAGNNCERCQEGFYGIALNKGNCTRCDCGVHGKNCNHVTGKCACTTKGIIGDNCNKCDPEYKGNATSGTCYYKVIPDFQYSFRMKPEVDREVTKLNCQITPENDEPDIQISVKTTQDENTGNYRELKVNVTTYLEGEPEELIESSNSTHKFDYKVSHKDFEFGVKTNRSLRIYIHGFETPVIIKVSVTQQSSMNLLTFFLVFFACFLSLLLIAVIVWKLKTMYDVYQTRQAAINEMREMAARPFAQVQLNTHIPPEIFDEQPQPVCYEVLEDNTAAVATVFLVLPRHEDGSPPIGHSSLCFGSVMISFDEKTEQDLLLPILPSTATARTDGVDNPTCVDVAHSPH